MSELVARLPRTRRIRPRKPKPHEAAGLVLMLFGGFDCWEAWQVIRSGRYLDGLMPGKDVVGHSGWPNSPIAEWIMIGIATLLAIMALLFGIALAWDWLRDPWQHD